MLFEGTQRGLFSLLFGAGVLLLTERIDARGGDASQVFFRRNLWLIVFGIVHGYLLLWTGEILFFYGATAPFVYAFRKATPRTLFAFALGGLLVGAAWNQLDAYERDQEAHGLPGGARRHRPLGATLTRPQTKALKAWPELVDEMNPNADKIRDTLESMRGSYTTVVAFQAPMVAHYESWFQYRYFFDVWSLMLIGMALFKLGLLHLGHPRGAYVWMVVARLRHRPDGELLRGASPADVPVPRAGASAGRGELRPRTPDDDGRPRGSADAVLQRRDPRLAPAAASPPWARWR